MTFQEGVHSIEHQAGLNQVSGVEGHYLSAGAKYASANGANQLNLDEVAALRDCWLWFISYRAIRGAV